MKNPTAVFSSRSNSFLLLNIPFSNRFFKCALILRSILFLDPFRSKIKSPLDNNWEGVVTTNVSIKPLNHDMASPDYPTVLSNIHLFYNLLYNEERKIEMKRVQLLSRADK